MSTQNPTGYQKVAPDPIRQRAIRIMQGTRTHEEKIFSSLEELIEVINYLRSMGCIIVLTMGTWDLYHEGHGKYIRLAKEEARKRYPNAEKVLQVVAVDSDELTRERKGPKRPVVKEAERCSIICDHESVDMIIIEREFKFLHRNLPHDARVISSSTHDKMDEDTSRYCEQLINLPPQSETSTTARVRRLILEGGQDALKDMRAGFETLFKELEDRLNVRE